MTQEEKAKAYDETIEKLRNFYRDYDTVSRLIDVKEELANRFPELKKSEDEIVRKWIIDYLNNRILNSSILDEKESCKKALAWLEKQGEPKQDVNMQINPSEYINDMGGNGCYLKNTTQMPTDKVEPKFKVGDWIIYRTGDTVIQIVNNKNFYESVEIWGQERTDTYNYIEQGFRLWTIEDAKDGDVLAVTMYPEGTWIGMFKEHNGCTFSSYCFVNTEGTFKLGTHNHGNGKAIRPATKEQRNLLFQKMKESGYEWDVNKKELKIIDWSKHIKYEPNSPSITKEHPTWSEDDEKNFNEAISYIKDTALRNWLISLKDRVQPHPQQEWSDEDEKKRTLLISILEVNHPNGYFKVNPANTLNMEAMHTEELVDWLKSLKDRYTWKPSEEQITALNYAVNLMASSESLKENDYYYNVFKDLREQLKKLREE